MNLNDAFAIKYNTRQQDANTNQFEALSKDRLGGIGMDIAKQNADATTLTAKKAYDNMQPSSFLGGAMPSLKSSLGSTTGVAPGAAPVVTGLTPMTDADKLKSPLGFKRGATKVPGKGSGKVDTVPAMLAPGEAVLNKAAAQKMGRDKIAAANKAGAKQMGIQGKGKPGHYAEGTANVKPPLIKRIADFVMGAPKPAQPAPAQPQGPRNVGPAVTPGQGGQYMYTTYGSKDALDARVRRAMGEE
jgi:hypothetical protein